jgi:hypothetical protein
VRRMLLDPIPSAALYTRMWGRGVGSCNAVELTPSDLLLDLSRGVGCLGVCHWIGFPVRLSRSLSLSLSRHVHGSKWLLVSYRH